MADMPEQCPVCQGNDGDKPCLYPSEGKQGCLRDIRLYGVKKMPDNIIKLHNDNVLIPSIPAGRIHCSFCHQPRKRKELITGATGKVTICFTCVEKASELIK